MSSEMFDDLDCSGNSLKITAKIFVQIEVFWPKNSKGKSVTGKPLYDLIRKKYFDVIQPLGYVIITAGFGRVYDSCPGYWIVFRLDGEYLKLKMGNSRDEFSKNLQIFPDWNSLEQIFL